MRKLAKKGGVLSFFSVLLGMSFAGTGWAGTVEIEMVALDVSGTKIWFPSTVVAKKGDVVKVHAVSKVPGKNNIHGLAIDAFKIQSNVDDKGQNIEFTADKAGIFPIRCHLHPTHVGGQLVVLE